MMKKKLFNIDPGPPPISTHQHAIAVIGMDAEVACAKGLDAMWDLIAGGFDAVGSLPAGRKADIAQIMAYRQESNYRFEEAGFVNDLAGFDHAFFNIPYDEAVIMNPMHRKVMQVAWRCIEDAGYTKEKIGGSRTGCYMGYSWNMNSYYDLVCSINKELSNHAIVPNIGATLPGRIAYYFDLRGPAVVVDTACSSSLKALQEACEQIAAGRIDAALVGGVNLTFGVGQAAAVNLGIESGSHRSLTFDDAADGTGKGEGVVMVLVKSLSAAIRDGDNIYAVIKGWAANNDGGRSVGMAAPSVNAQEEVLLQAWQHAGIHPSSLGYIEAHGTGTKLGDPIEVEALTNAFRKYTTTQQGCAIGSLKANIGHLDTAAGIAGFVKAVLCLQHKMLPPAVNFELPNSRIAFLESPVYVNTHLTPWPQKWMAGVSAFGISGTNVHVVIAGYDQLSVQVDEGCALLPLSAKTTAGLTQLVECYDQLLLRDLTDADAFNICHSARYCRQHHAIRIALIVSGITDLRQKIGLVKDCLANGQMPEQQLCYQQHNSVISTDKYTSVLTLANNYINKKELPKPGKAGYRFRLPVYPFESTRCWPVLPVIPAASTSLVNGQENNYSMHATSAISQKLKEIVTASLEGNVDLSDTSKTFFELGFDSINIVHVKYRFQQQFNIDLPVEALFSHLNSIDKLAAYVAEETTPIPASASPTSTHFSEDFPADVRQEPNDDLISNVIKRQLEIMAAQLKLLKNENKEVSAQQLSVNNQVIMPSDKADDRTVKRPASHYYTDSGSAFNDTQQQFIQRLIKKVMTKTAGSRAHAQQYRNVFASYRKAMYYDHYFKDLVYPICASSTQGCKMMDIDGNTYIDFVMGFGVHLLGYNPPEVINALLHQVDNGVFVGPMSPLAGEVAKMIAAQTGMERVAYANSGTEAVMHAIKIARACTKKDLVVKFSNAYHGFYEVMQADPDPYAPLNSIPNSLGIPKGITGDVMVLEFGKDSSLEVIRQNIGRIACVITEPVQSRRPEFQPVEFMQELRRITQAGDVPLIFDEIITGFRVHPKGAVGLYNIEPDILTLGKVLGGGMPMGAVCGKKKYLDYMDGGYWQYGDDSRPSENRIGTGGTFCHHPLAMASAKAVLTIIREKGSMLYDSLEQKTNRLKEQLNNYFSDNDIPIRIVSCASLFSFKPLLDVKVMQVLYYLLLEKGIYLWQGATCFMSAAHTDDDIDVFINIVKDACGELINNGFIAGKGMDGAIPKVAMKSSYEVSPSQGRLWFMHQLYKKMNVYNLATGYKLSMQLDVAAFQEALELVVRRHEILRTTIRNIDNEPRQFIHDYNRKDYGIVDSSMQIMDESTIRARMATDMEEVFDLENGPLFRVIIYKSGPETFYLFANFHHLIADGFSIEIVLKELFLCYYAVKEKRPASLPELAVQYKDYSAWINKFLRGPEGKLHRDYWMNRLGALAERVQVPLDFNRPEQPDFAGNSVLIVFTPEQSLRLHEIARLSDATLFMILLAIIKILINKQAGDGNVLVGCPYSGRFAETLNNQIGFYVNTVVLADAISGEDTFFDVLAKVKQTLLEAGKHQVYPFDSLVRDLGKERHLSRNQLFDIDVNMNDQDLGNYQQVKLGGSGILPVDLKPAFSKFDLTFSIFKGTSISISLEYKTSLYDHGTIVLMKGRMLSIADEIIANRIHIPIREFQYDKEVISAGNVFESNELF